MAFPLLPEGNTARDTALLRLGITREQVSAAPQITPQLRAITRTLRRAGQNKTIRRDKVVNSDVDSTNQTTVDVTVETRHTSPYGAGTDLLASWPHYLASSEHDAARKVLLAYHGLPESVRKGYFHRDMILPIEAYCVAAGVSPLTILGIITGEIVRMGAQASAVIAAVNHPRVVQKSVEMALTDDGILDRTLLAKATGFLPTPKGSQTNINVQTNANASAAPQIAVVAPPPEQTTRRLADKLNEIRGLPAAQPSNLPDRMPYEDAIAVEVDSGDDEE